MITCTVAEIADWVGGTLTPQAEPTARITGAVEYDSRRVAHGDVFVALAGEKHDGHDYLDQVYAAGAVVALVSRPVSHPAIVVDDVLVALGKLARAVMDRLPQLTIIGITGSSGKTSTKDILACVLAGQGELIAPVGSFNNELGHPYTVLKASDTTQFVIAEKSARGLGHIRYLTEIAPPKIGVVLNVGTAHVGEFGSVETIAEAKSELVQALPDAAAGGVAVLNADDPAVAAMADKTAARVATYGMCESADIRAVDSNYDEFGRASYRLLVGSDSATVTLPLPGEHQVSNSLAVAAVALEVGMPLEEVALALGQVRVSSPRRMAVHTRPDSITVVDDSYNANPASMRAGLNAVAGMACGGQRWAVLGKMAELGDFHDREHRQLGQFVAQLGIDQLVVVGDTAQPIGLGAFAGGMTPEQIHYCNDQSTAIAFLDRQIQPKDIVLIKASRYVLWQVADALTKSDRVTITSGIK